jgi:hypothetical protein
MIRSGRGVLISLIIMPFMPTISLAREIKLIVRRDDSGITEKGGNANAQTVYETGVIPVSPLSIFYVPGAARGMRYHATAVETFFSN